MAIQMTSPAFKEGQPIPVKHTGQGNDVSPALSWTGAPPGTKSFALVVEDPDAPAKTWIHWVVWNIPADAAGMPEAAPPKAQLENGTRQGLNDFRRIGYGGPMPPPGKPHRYCFKLFALDARPELNPGADEAALLKAIKGHVLAEGQLLGTSKRQ